MTKRSCERRGCTRVRTEFGMFLGRKRPPRLDQRTFCSENCLQECAQDELRERWHRLQQEKGRHIPRPKLGTILLERAMITQD
jgi:hypothetical protein